MGRTTNVSLDIADLLSGVLFFLLFQPSVALAQVGPEGNFQTVIPIDVAPYHGLEPPLSLVYNSNGGNRFVGVGWGLAGLSSIQRASRGKGVPSYDSNDVSKTSQDIALLDGMELLKCYSWMSSPSCKTPTSASTRYVYYATKIESFQRIAYDPATPIGVWYVWRKDGTKLTYGGHFQTARLTQSGTYRWLLESVTDRSGNTVAYGYECDTTTSPYGDECYPSAISYNFDPSSEALEKVIFYRESRRDIVTYAMGGNSIATVRQRLKTVDVLVHDSTGDHRARAYKLTYSTSASSGRSVLAAVQQFGTDGKLDSTGTVISGTALPPVTLLPLSNGSLGKWTGESKTPSIKIPGPPHIGPPPLPSQLIIRDIKQWSGVYDFFSDSHIDYSAVFTGDANGDGRIDVMLANAADPTPAIPYVHLRLFTLLSNPDGSWSPIEYDTPQAIDYQTLTITSHKGGGGDVNGDGKTDFVLLTHHGANKRGDLNYDHFSIITAVSRGDGTYDVFEKDTKWGWDPSARIFLGDADGDGKTDIMGAFCAPLDAAKAKASGSPYPYSYCSTNAILAVALSNGHGFDWTYGYQDTGIALSDNDVYMVGDANGDGKTDFMVAEYHQANRLGDPNPNEHFGLRTYFSVGDRSLLGGTIPPSAFFYQTLDDTVNIPVSQANLSNLYHRFAVADVNADGLTDFSIILEHEYCDAASNAVTPCTIGAKSLHNAIASLFSGGTGKYTRVDYDVGTPDDVFYSVQWVPGDMNGDGRVDYMRVGTWQDTDRVVYATLQRVISVGDGTYQVASRFNSRILNFVGPPQVVDYDGDGYGDYLSTDWNTDWCWDVGVYRQCGYHFQVRIQTTSPSGQDIGSWKSGDFNGDGRSDLAHLGFLSPGIEIGTFFRAADGSWAISQNPQQILPSTAVPGLDDPSLIQRAIPMDVNGDGKTDLVVMRDYIQPNGWRGLGVYTFLSNGDASWKASYFDLSAAGFSSFAGLSSALQWIPMDFHGDGRTGLVQVRALRTDDSCADGGTSCYPGIRVSSLSYNLNGNWEVKVSDLKLGDPVLYANYSWRPIDVNGDGRADLVLPIYDPGFSTLRIQTLLSRGDGTWTPVADDVWVGTGESDTFHWIPMDVNGDGAVDLVRVSWRPQNIFSNMLGLDFQIHTFVSSGDGHWRHDKPAELSIEGGDYFTPAAIRRVADVNKDGRADLVHLSWSPTKGLRVTSWLSNGAGNAWTPVTDPNALGLKIANRSDLLNWRVADLNGDGEPDLVNPGFDLTQGGYRFLGALGTQVLDVVAQIQTSMGGSTRISYAPSSMQSRLNDPNSNCGVPAGLVLQTIASVKTGDGRGNSSIQHYQYECPVWDYAERGLIGWSHIVLSQPASAATPPLRGETFYKLTDRCWAQPTRRVITDSTGSPFTKAETDYYDNCLPAVHRDYECNGTTTCRETDTDFTYDDFGNLAIFNEYGVLGVAGNERSTARTYYYNTDAYIVGLPGSEAVYQGIGTKGPMKSQTLYCYDVIGSPLAGCGTALKKGLLTSAWAWDDQTGKYQIFIYGYDGFGNRTVATDPNAHTTNITYDYGAQNQYPTQICNALKQCSSQEWDYRFGKTRKLIDPNKTPMETVYDELGRVKNFKYPDGGTLSQSYYDWGNPNLQRVRLIVEDGSADGLWVDNWFDGLGRTYRIVRKGDSPGVTFTQDTTYDSTSLRIYKQCRPYRIGAGPVPAPVCEVFKYDAATRLVSQTHADRSSFSLGYGSDQANSSTTFHDEQGHEIVAYTDAYGRAIEVREKNAGEYYHTRYEYDVLNHLSKITDNAGNVSTISWDSLGRKIGSDDPDMGDWTYKYDAVGNQVSQTDARRITTLWSYDELNRQKTEQANPPNGDIVTRKYDENGHGDAVGRLTSIVEPTAGSCPSGVADSFVYDSMGRVTSHGKCVLGTSYSFSFSYDKVGHLKSITYPPDNPSTSPVNDILNYRYDPAGRLYGASGYVNSLRYDAVGKLKEVDWSNRISGIFDYDPTRDWLKRARFARRGNYCPVVRALCWILGCRRFLGPRFRTINEFSYNHSPDGLIDHIEEKSATRKIQDFRYDDLHRLREVSGTFPQQFDYDDLGNMKFNSAIGGYTYPVSGPNGCGKGISCAHPHAVTQAGTLSYGYDADGNMNMRNGKTVEWDYRNLVQRIDAGNGMLASFLYDSSGQRVFQEESSKISRYFPPFLEQKGTAPSGLLKYYYAGPMLVARKDSNGGKIWYHQDYLGSTRLLSDSLSAAVRPYDYKAFGETASLSSGIDPATDIRYIGHRSDDGTGLIYLDARYYDPVLARFISADDLLSRPFNPQNLNRYSYVRNNPINYSDPSGHQAADDQSGEDSMGMDLREGYLWYHDEAGNLVYEFFEPLRPTGSGEQERGGQSSFEGALGGAESFLKKYSPVVEVGHIMSEPAESAARGTADAAVKRSMDAYADALVANWGKYPRDRAFVNAVEQLQRAETNARALTTAASTFSNATTAAAGAHYVTEVGLGIAKTSAAAVQGDIGKTTEAADELGSNSMSILFAGLVGLMFPEGAPVAYLLFPQQPPAEFMALNPCGRSPCLPPPSMVYDGYTGFHDYCLGICDTSSRAYDVYPYISYYYAVARDCRVVLLTNGRGLK